VTTSRRDGFRSLRQRLQLRNQHGQILRGQRVAARQIALNPTDALVRLSACSSKTVRRYRNCGCTESESPRPPNTRTGTTSANVAGYPGATPPSSAPAAASASHGQVNRVDVSNCRRGRIGILCCRRGTRPAFIGTSTHMQISLSGRRTDMNPARLPNRNCWCLAVLSVQTEDFRTRPMCGPDVRGIS
jgi:hypothetical protein